MTTCYTNGTTNGFNNGAFNNGTFNNGCPTTCPPFGATTGFASSTPWCGPTQNCFPGFAPQFQNQFCGTFPGAFQNQFCPPFQNQFAAPFQNTWQQPFNGFFPNACLGNACPDFTGTGCCMTGTNGFPNGFQNTFQNGSNCTPTGAWTTPWTNASTGWNNSNGWNNWNSWCNSNNGWTSPSSSRWSGPFTQGWSNGWTNNWNTPFQPTANNPWSTPWTNQWSNQWSSSCNTPWGWQNNCPSNEWCCVPTFTPWGICFTTVPTSVYANLCNNATSGCTPSFTTNSWSGFNGACPPAFATGWNPSWNQGWNQGWNQSCNQGWNQTCAPIFNGGFTPSWGSTPWNCGPSFPQQFNGRAPWSNAFCPPFAAPQTGFNPVNGCTPNTFNGAPSSYASTSKPFPSQPSSGPSTAPTTSPSGYVPTCAPTSNTPNYCPPAPMNQCAPGMMPDMGCCSPMARSAA